jgi:hypothetical protein
LDSYGCSAAWEPIADAATSEPLKCQSVGWLIKDDPDFKVVVPHLSGADHPNIHQQGCGDMAIPTRAIVRMVDLSVPPD